MKYSANECFHVTSQHICSFLSYDTIHLEHRNVCDLKARKTATFNKEYTYMRDSNHHLKHSTFLFTFTLHFELGILFIVKYLNDIRG